MANVLVNRKVWIIISKDRKIIAKGVPRNRYLCRVDDDKDNKRILFYTSEAKATTAFKNNWFYDGDLVTTSNHLEAVAVNMILEEIV